MENQNSKQQEETVQSSSSSNVNSNGKFSGGQILESDNSTQSQNSESNKAPFARFSKSKNRKKSVIFILVPVMFFGFAQSGPLWVAVMLMSPVLAIFFVYGVVLFFKKDKEVPELLDINNNIYRYRKKSYKHGSILLVIGLILCLFAYISVQNVRQSAGYSGSEGEIVAFPFIISGAVILLIAIINLLLTFASNFVSKSEKLKSFLDKNIF